jgi:hypothetical protein
MLLYLLFLAQALLWLNIHTVYPLFFTIVIAAPYWGFGLPLPSGLALCPMPGDMRAFPGLLISKIKLRELCRQKFLRNNLRPAATARCRSLDARR